jgi:hypothetical protein
MKQLLLMLPLLMAVLSLSPAAAHSASSVVAQSACVSYVKQAYRNPLLRIQNYDGASGTPAARENSKVHLWRALVAGENGNEAECWNQFGWAAYFEKPPQMPTRAQTAEAAR